MTDPSIQRRTFLSCLPSSLAWLAGPSHPAPVQDDSATRVLTYNVRYGSAKDGDDRWELRRPKVISLLRDWAPALLGLQEAEHFQLQHILSELPHYAALGVARDDGRLAGEGCFLLYDRSRFSVAATETFWLSSTPRVPGSMSYGNQLPRIATWARFVRLNNGTSLQVLNTHYDHRSQASREASSRQLLTYLEDKAQEGEAVVLLGDFNADLGNPALKLLLEAGFACAVSSHDPNQRIGTFTGFRIDSDGGERTLDHLFVRGPLSVQRAGIDARKIEGRYPSDHFPVWADLLP